MLLNINTVKKENVLKMKYLLRKMKEGFSIKIGQNNNFVLKLQGPKFSFA